MSRSADSSSFIRRSRRETTRINGNQQWLVVCLRFDLVEGGASALNLGDDVVGGGLPDEWLWVVVPVLRPRGDCGGEVGDAGESATAQAFVGEFLEPAFDQVQPGTRSRRVVQVPAAAVLVR